MWIFGAVVLVGIILIGVICAEYKLDQYVLSEKDALKMNEILSKIKTLFNKGVTLESILDKLNELDNNVE